MAVHYFSDGGTCVTNPSRIGGAWAWVAIEDDKIVAEGRGTFTPTDIGLPACSNNVAELMAAVEALESIPEGELMTGWLHTDSGITLGRLSPSAKRFNGVPHGLIARVRMQVNRLWPRVRLIGGHPTKADLKRGFIAKSGFPCSKWNVIVDKICKSLCRDLLLKENANVEV